MAYLGLVRHGESEWNALGLWTGLTDVSLTQKGRAEARKTGEEIKRINVDVAFTSPLQRARQTLEEIMKVFEHKSVKIVESLALIERDYGDLTGKNKWKIREEYGEEQFMKWRRSWDHPVPNGETLKDVFNRVIPYYQKEIMPVLAEGKNVLVVAHGNSLRALRKEIEGISDEEIVRVELETGKVYGYDVRGKKGNLSYSALF